MKRVCKKISLVGLILLYGCLVSFSSSYPLADSPLLTDARQQPESGSFNSTFTKDLLCHTSHSENFLSIVAKAPVPLLKSNMLYYAAVIKKADRIVQHKFLQYNYYSINILSRLQSPDIVFPFHYFW